MAGAQVLEAGVVGHIQVTGTSTPARIFSALYAAVMNPGQIYRDSNID